MHIIFLYQYLAKKKNAMFISIVLVKLAHGNQENRNLDFFISQPIDRLQDTRPQNMVPWHIE